MSPIVRRIVYVLVFELLAISLVAFTFSALGHSGSSAMATAVVSSVIAMTWNFIWTSLFEAWERRQPSQTRTVPRRIAYSLGFEAGLVVFLVPAMALLLGVGLLEAFLLDIGLMVFFLVYAFVFSWLFDLIVPRRDEKDAGGSPEAEPETL
ncbi:PACE efflux transporter [Leucobacter sp. UCMA 4100]|uniref:PACE efflux transporter n=1 Tax=Leucobacter sp. UCMA 4100 TaxID=2810534 RepID=UPI0022EA14F6|nr:PACE efflux transporter [Leucobacter sp. UCMA 4100]MDA3147960.1 PACE efflux transporter [Leucobacter sp. UCMA 4100]